MKTTAVSRREALGQLTLLAGALSTGSWGRAANDPSSRALLGLDAHSVRAMKWKAPQLITYAAEQRVDAVLFNGFQYFDSLEESHLREIKQLADRHRLIIRIGAGSISKGAVKYNSRYGTPEETLARGIKVATLLGSPTVNCRIGSIEDRYTDGGIQARLEEVAKTMQATRSRAEAAGVTFAFENHAGDTRSEEVLGLIDTVGRDLCGVMLDPGNSLWAMEDPMEQLRKLGPHVQCMSIRDYMVWATSEGATFQWTAIGEGMMDVPAYSAMLHEYCPSVPLFVESISNSPRLIPYLTEAFWKGFPDVPAAGIVDFLALVRKGYPLPFLEPTTGESQKDFDQRHQKREFEHSIETLRRCIA